MPSRLRLRIIGTVTVSSHRLRHSVLLFFTIAFGWLLVPGAGIIHAQDALQSIGIQPFSEQIPVQNGSVNVSNGNVHLEFPLVALPQRGANPLEAKIVYDSNLWYQENSTYAYQTGNSGGTIGSLAGWNITSSIDVGYVDSVLTPHNICHLDGSEDYDAYTYPTWTSSDSVTHRFDSLSYSLGFVNSCGDYTSMTTPVASAVADDGSGYRMTVTGGLYTTVYSKDGSAVDSWTNNISWEDSNGNYFSCPMCLLSAGLTDTLGRTPISFSTSGMTNTIQLSNAGKNGGVSNYVVTYETINYYTNFGLSSYERSGSFKVIQSIQLPDGTTYSFTYDSGTTAGHYGDLKSMTLPTGSTINFTYANFNDSEVAPAGYTHHATRMLSTMTTPDGAWTFTPTVLVQCTSTIQTCEQQIQVTKPAYNTRSDIDVYKSLVVYKGIYHSGPAVAMGPYPIEADYYNGSISTSNLLATLVRSFDFSQTCAGAPWNLVGVVCSDPTMLSKTVTLPMPSGTSINQTTQYCYDIVYGNLLNKWEWNFYTGATIHDPNPPTSCSVYTGVPTPDRTTTYAYLGGSNYLVEHPQCCESSLQV